ncbi:hypothetical protein G352_02699 [Rhodococcus ruber BKS 20-38]|uniref:Uncharacterized protein n=1 Tax=Rhodococcus ruber BKS 20-38 TaxID=1278076 RepID=M2YXU3_9NOCA|nr:hypothetical protein G352_02699 [Rhodococcus ruber BKS 20-38]
MGGAVQATETVTSAEIHRRVRSYNLERSHRRATAAGSMLPEFMIVHAQFTGPTAAEAGPRTHR